MVSESVDSGCHKLSENMWFMLFKRSYSRQKVGCDVCGRRIMTEWEDRARSLDSEFAVHFALLVEAL